MGLKVVARMPLGVQEGFILHDTDSCVKEKKLHTRILDETTLVSQKIAYSNFCTV